MNAASNDWKPFVLIPKCDVSFGRAQKRCNRRPSIGIQTKRERKKNTYTDKLDIIDVVWKLCIRKKKNDHLDASCFVLFKLLMHTLFAVKVVCSVFQSNRKCASKYTFGQTFSAFTLHLWHSIEAHSIFFRFALLFAYFFFPWRSVSVSSCTVVQLRKDCNEKNSLLFNCNACTVCGLDTSWRSPLFASTYFEAQHFFPILQPIEVNGAMEINTEFHCNFFQHLKIDWDTFFVCDVHW